MTMKRALIGTLATALISGTALGAPTPEQTCQAEKNLALGKYALCLHRMERFTFDPIDLQGAYTDKYWMEYLKCGQKLQEAWAKATVKAADAGATCLDDPASVHDFKAFVAEKVTGLADKMAGAVLPDCAADVAACQADLAFCQSPPVTAFPATGQTIPHGAGSDGDLEAGATMSFTDNGDGTITDNNTKLMWEKKDSVGSVHDYLNTYSWGDADPLGIVLPPFTMNGTVVTDFLDVLNDTAGGGANCFAGYCDWRLPNPREIVSIIDFSVAQPAPTVHAAFHDPVGCLACIDVTQPSCTCAVNGNYYTSASLAGKLDAAYVAHSGTGFFTFGLTTGSKYEGYARAVRGPL